ncbi:sensor histidine kinase [Actinacidiphila rubida]|uniref:Oxygen sensor histidine kinase NreB n=1 Tax=Actinacidiphila rubida TaxID=310780 RepID=A0A1H8KBZ8_9ACTN|nr:ATP-binding protein [Actinacidiphila rubida]SEN90522.1 two-component system, NarL family, nitrate/nitrite sensor histidine kinase NarX [Actinacidiphila rubida]
MHQPYGKATISDAPPRPPTAVRRPPVVLERHTWRDPRHVARELHDRVGSELAVVLRQLELAQLFVRDDPKSAEERLEQGLRAVSEAMRVVRELSGELSGAGTSCGRLADDLRAFAGGVAPAGTRVRVRTDGDESWLPPGHRGQLFLILCELLRNAFAHARAGTVRVRTRITPDAVTAVVEDDGVGFDPSTGIPPGHGFGLVSMGERAHGLGGATRIESAAGRGTRVTVRLPLAGTAASTGQHA